MEAKVFVLGLPGSGKSVATQHISMVARDRNCRVSTFNDYDILRSKFELAPDGPQFSRAANNGFDVHDYTVLDTSLRELEQQVFQKESTSDKEITVIEFARNNYIHALQQFSASILQDAYILFIDAENDICKERTRKRNINPSSSDDHYVSDYIFEAYYNKGREYCVAARLNELRDSNDVPYNVDARKIAVVDNRETTSIEAFYENIERITVLITNQQSIAAEPIDVVHDK